jgi:hypothetical protein
MRLDGGDRFRGSLCRGERGWNVHDQDGVVLRILEQRLECGGVARRIGIAGNVDRIRARPDRRQRRVELVHRFRRNPGESPAEISEAIHGEHADAAAIREYRQPLARKWPHAFKCLGRSEQLVEIENSQETGAAKRSVVDRVSTGKGPGMRLRRFGRLCMAAGLDDHHRFDASGRARRRHEFARVVDRLDVKENRSGRAVEREEIEQIAEIYVDLVAERDGRRKPDSMCCRPLDKARGDGT